MYEAYFHLQKRPFSATPDATCFFATDAIQELLDQLVLRAEGGEGIGIVTGAAGTGKTLLCRRIAAELAPRMTPIFLANSNFPTRRALLQSLLFELGRKYSGMEEQELRLTIFGLLRELAMTGRGAVLIVDEAHLLSDRLLEELRLLVCLAEEDQPLARVILAGQPALEERLISPRLEALNQRIACHLYLEPLTRGESIEYVRHRINWAGADASQMFTDDALESIAAASMGLPRCLNQLCDHALLLTFVQEEPRVTAETVAEALLVLRQLPLQWDTPVSARTPLSDLSETNDENDEDLEAECEAEVAELSPVAVGAVRQPQSSADTVCFEIGGEEVADEDSSVDSESISLLDDHRRLFGATSEMISRTVERSIDEQRGRNVVPLSDVAPRGLRSPAVEPVVDRYALLDVTMPRVVRTFEDAPVPANWLPATCSDVPGAPEPRDVSAEADVDNVYPVEILSDESVEALAFESMPAADEYDSVDPLVDETVDFLPDRVAEETLDAEPQFAGSVGHDRPEIEEELHVEILDACREIQAVTGSWREEEIPVATARAQQSLDDMLEDVVLPEPVRDFDVVEPESPAVRRTVRGSVHESRTLDTPPAGRQVPKPKYRMIFSTLRRRLGRGR